MTTYTAAVTGSYAGGTWTGGSPQLACEAAIPAFNAGYGASFTAAPSATGGTWTLASTECHLRSGGWYASGVITGHPTDPDPEPDPEPGTGTTVTCSVSPCSITVHHEVRITHPLLDLTPVEGAQIAGAILAMWAIGFIFRMLRQALDIGGKQPTFKED